MMFFQVNFTEVYRLLPYDRGKRLAVLYVFCIVLVCICITYQGRGQQSQIDSMEELLKKEHNVEIRLEYLSQLADVASGFSLQQALTYTRRGIDLAQKLDNKNWKPIFYEKHGRMNANLLELDSATHYFHQAMQGYLAVDDKRGQATTAFKIAWVYKRRGQIEMAMDFDLKGLRLMEEIDDKIGIASALGRVSEDLMRQGRQSEALEYAKKAIAVCKEHGLKGELFYANRSAGDACIAAGDNEEALKYYDHSLTIARDLKLDKFSLVDITVCRGNANKRLGKYQQALIDYQKSLEFANEVNYKNGINVSIGNLGEVNLLIENFEEALPYQLETIKLQEASGDNSNLAENYQHAATIYSELGNFKAAWQYERKSRELREFIMSSTSDARISELRTEYETDKKEATIMLQREQLYNRNRMIWLSLGVALLLAILLFFLFRTYRERIRTNKLLSAKNDENELLLKEIHHRVKNNLEVVSSLLLLQSSQIEDKKVKEAMQEGQNRVQSIGLLHQKLYQGQSLGAIEMKEYFINLSESILDTFGADGRVTIECAMDQLDLDIDNAVPLGLIVNELLTNTMKYAFPDGREGQVHIELKQTDEHVLRLEVADNGIGKSESTNGSGFGSQLIDLLTRQLNGTMREEISGGSRFVFNFNLEAVHV